MAENVVFKFVVSLTSNENAREAALLFRQDFRDGCGFSVSTVSDTSKIYIATNGSGGDPERLRDYLSQVQNRMDLPEIIAFAFIKDKGVSEDSSGIMIYTTSTDDLKIVSANEVVNLHQQRFTIA